MAQICLDLSYIFGNISVSTLTWFCRPDDKFQHRVLQGERQDTAAGGGDCSAGCSQVTDKLYIYLWVNITQTYSHVIKVCLASF